MTRGHLVVVKFTTYRAPKNLRGFRKQYDGWNHPYGWAYLSKWFDIGWIHKSMTHTTISIPDTSFEFVGGPLDGYVHNA